VKKVKLPRDPLRTVPDDPEAFPTRSQSTRTDVDTTSTVQDEYSQTTLIVMPELSEIRAGLADGSITKQGAAGELVRRIPRLADDLRRAKADIARRGSKSR